VRSRSIANEIKELERELSALRSRLDEDDSSFSALEREIDQLRERLTETRDSVRLHETRLAEKRVELAAVERLERLDAYEEDIKNAREARKHIADSAQTFLAELDKYDGEVLGLRELLDEMQTTFGDDDQRIAALKAALTEEAYELSDCWQAIVDAVKWRIVPNVKTDAAPTESNGKDLGEDLRKQAEERRRSRILEYFNKT
jgi:predicted  nucleic acid-binding Zn-ribbon protein